MALTHEVLEPAGAGQHDVGAAAQVLHLRVLADPAEDGHGREAGGLGEGLERLVDLTDELAGRGQDQCPRLARHGRHPRVDEAGHDGQQERVGLAGAGAAAAEHVASGERVREGRGLDGGRSGDALGGQDRHEVGRKAQVSKGGWSRSHGDITNVVCLAKLSRRRRDRESKCLRREGRRWTSAGPVELDLGATCAGARGKTDRAAALDVTAIGGEATHCEAALGCEDAHRPRHRSHRVRR